MQVKRKLDLENNSRPMLQLKIDNNIVTAISCGAKDKSLLHIPDHGIVRIGHDIRIFDENFSRFLSLDELMEKGIILPRRFMFEPYYGYYIREIYYTEPHYPNETEIPPPIDNVNSHEIPIFDGKMWKIVENNFWIPEYSEVNYDAGRSSKTLNLENSGYSLIDYMAKFPPIPSIPSLMNSDIMIFVIKRKVDYIHREMTILKHNFEHKEADIFYQYKEVLESIIFQMKTVIDMFVQLSSLLVDYNYILDKHALRVDSLGCILNNKDCFEHTIIFGDGEKYKSDDSGFLRIINDLFNSIKHSILHSETSMQFGVDVPTVLSLYAKSNKFTEMIYFHNHNAYHLLMGFEDSMIRILENLNTYYELNIINSIPQV